MSDKNYVEDAICFLAGYAAPISTWGAIGYKTSGPCVQLYDRNIVDSLAYRYDSGRPFSIKQGQLALRIVTKYRARLKKEGFDVETMIERELFRRKPEEVVIIKHHIICLEEDSVCGYQIVVAHPYDADLINIIKKFNVNNSRTPYSWEEKKKFWYAPLNMKTLSLVELLICKERKFTCSHEIAELLIELDRVEKEVKKPSATINDGKLVINNLFPEQKTTIRSMIDAISE